MDQVHDDPGDEELDGKVASLERKEETNEVDLILGSGGHNMAAPVVNAQSNDDGVGVALTKVPHGAVDDNSLREDGQEPKLEERLGAADVVDGLVGLGEEDKVPQDGEGEDADGVGERASGEATE